MATEGEIKAHEQTYTGFTAMMKWGTIAVFISGLLIVFLIS